MIKNFIINLIFESHRRHRQYNLNERHHTTNDSGPIGLSLMVTVSQLWMIHTMDEAIKTAKARGLVVPRNIFIYITVTDPPLRPGLRNRSTPCRDPAEEFNKCLNSVHERVQFTKEVEENQTIAFLDALVTRHDDGSLTTQVFRKPSNTNICIKPNSCQDPKVAMGAFKGELCRCHRLCTSTEQIKKETEFVVDLFEDNGFDREKKLKNIAEKLKKNLTFILNLTKNMTFI